MAKDQDRNPGFLSNGKLHNSVWCTFYKKKQVTRILLFSDTDQTTGLRALENYGIPENMMAFKMDPSIATTFQDFNANKTETKKNKISNNL